MFLLLNSLDEEEEEVLLSDALDKEFFGDDKKEQDQGVNKLVIGQGTYGKIKICMVLVSP